MERNAAAAEADRLNAEHDERDRFQWFVRETAGTWAVVRVPRVSAKQALTEMTKPAPDAPHPAPPSEPNPYWGAG
jgi:hypothetical protein